MYAGAANPTVCQGVKVTEALPEQLPSTGVAGNAMGGRINTCPWSLPTAYLSFAALTPAEEQTQLPQDHWEGFAPQTWPWTGVCAPIPPRTLPGLL